MIRVLMIGPDRSVHGGISGVVNNYYEAGLDHRITLHYIGTMVEGGKLRKLFKAAGAYVKFLTKLPFYEIVHVNMASDNSYRRKAVFIRTAHFFHKKIVIHQHGGDFETFYYKEQSAKGREKIQKILKMGDAFLVLAPLWKEFFGRMIGEEGITVLPDSIAIPEAFSKEYDNHNVLFLGRLCKEKGIGELLSCVPKLVDKVPDFHLYLGGIWEDKELREIAQSDKEHITWLGWVSGEDKKSWLAKCRMLVLPSYFEGQSVSLLEAMAYYCGIVASDTGGIPQMIRQEETGLLVPPKDAEALAEGLLKLLQDDELCWRLGDGARNKVEKEFGIEENMRKLIGIYESLLG
ncbi:MAG: glycosyltransferase family 4 protein [Lachnospiraceae bacterium]|nr:glycosyltransferase family 4 protein [Lachnospiraceae bacterium]